MEGGGLTVQSHMADGQDFAVKHPEPGEDGEKSLKAEILQLKNILATLTMKYKIAEDSRKVMTRRNSILFDDNQFLQDKLLDLEGRRILAEKETYDMSLQVKKLEEALKMFMNEGKEGVKKVMRCETLNAATSSTDLISTDDFCSKCGSKKEIICEVKNSESIIISGEEIHRIDEDMMELKGALQKREEACTRIWERERANRNKILKLNQEIQNLRNLNSWKANELDFRTRELKVKEMELNDAKKEILRLQNKPQPVKSQNSGMATRVKATPKKKDPVANPPMRFRQFGPAQRQQTVGIGKIGTTNSQKKFVNVN